MAASTQALLYMNWCMLSVRTSYASIYNIKWSQRRSRILRLKIFSNHCTVNMLIFLCHMNDYLLFFQFLGFWHEQSRADRDRYVKINTQNIIRGMEYNFLKYSLNKINHLQATYDTCSVMHYGPYAFSRNRRPTISRTRESSGAGCELGQRLEW